MRIGGAGYRFSCPKACEDFLLLQYGYIMQYVLVWTSELQAPKLSAVAVRTLDEFLIRAAGVRRRSMCWATSCPWWAPFLLSSVTLMAMLMVK